MLEIKPNLTKELILKHTTELQIFEHYCGRSLYPPETFSSPLREKDINPSFSIYVNKFNGRLWFKDYKVGSGDCFAFVQALHNNCDFLTALRIIDRDLRLNLNTIGNLPRPTRKEVVLKPQKEKDLQIRIQEYTKLDLHYWGKIKATPKILTYFGTYSTQYLWIDSMRIFDWTYTESNPIYSYVINKHIKSYRPFDKTKGGKWRSNCTVDDIFGYVRLPKKGKKVIITKSAKDALAFWMLGIPAVAVQGESADIPQWLIKDLKSRFAEVILFYDNDAGGIFPMLTASLEKDLLYGYIPREYYIYDKVKDMYEFIDKYGFKEAEYLLHELNLI